MMDCDLAAPGMATNDLHGSRLKDTEAADALLLLVATGGSVAARRRLLETHGTPAQVLAAGTRNWRSHALDERQIQALHVLERRNHIGGNAHDHYDAVAG